MTEEMSVRFVQARRAYIASQFSQLNDMQREAVLTTQGPLLLLAGAGSGKTTVLIHRIANLIRYGCAADSDFVPERVTEEDVLFLEQIGEPLSDESRAYADRLCALDPVAPWNIIAVTFTNKAANELKERLMHMVDPTAADVWAMTFHSACCRILRRYADRIGFDHSFTIYDTADSERVMKQIIKDMGLDDKTFPAKYVLGVIGKKKDDMISPEEMMAEAEASGAYRELPIARAYATYQKRLRENNALDFDDIILLTVRLLQENEDIRAYYQRKFRYVMVDEYQDTNHLQYLLSALLAGGYENICVVGDDDQSIYRFRGATIENILNFEKQYHGARLIRLEQNYRSTKAILKAANAVIANNRGRKGKTLWTANPQGEPITVYEAEDERAEAAFVTSKILAGRQRGASMKDFAVLYRTNAQSNALEYDLRRNGIAYRVIGGNRFFDRAEIKDMLAYLCVLNNPHDDLRLQRIINNPPRGLGSKTIDTAQRLAQAHGSSLYSVVSQCRDYAPLEKSIAKLEKFVSMLDELNALLAAGMSLPDFYEEVIRRTGYQQMLEEKPTEENLTRLENVRELKSSILSYVQEAEEPTLSGFLEEIALYTDIEEYNASDDAVVMMTMHAAKGLEFPNVFLVGFEDGLFPGMRAIGDRDEMEEERRLCYVAITRAKQALCISYARRRMIYGRTSAAMASRFLREIPEDILLRKGGYSPSYRVNTYEYRPAAQPTVAPSSIWQPQVAESAPILELHAGDMVTHSAFGAGMVLSVLKMGNDALLEIAFDQVGTKKLMARSASAHMKKQ